MPTLQAHLSAVMAVLIITGLILSFATLYAKETSRRCAALLRRRLVWRLTLRWALALGFSSLAVASLLLLPLTKSLP